MLRSPSDKMVRPGGKAHVLKKRHHVGNRVFYKGDVVSVGKYPELDRQIETEQTEKRKVRGIRHSK